MTLLKYSDSAVGASETIVLVTALLKGTHAPELKSFFLADVELPLLNLAK